MNFRLPSKTGDHTHDPTAEKVIGHRKRCIAGGERGGQDRCVWIIVLLTNDIVSIKPNAEHAAPGVNEPV